MIDDCFSFLFFLNNRCSCSNSFRWFFMGLFQILNVTLTLLHLYNMVASFLTHMLSIGVKVDTSVQFYISRSGTRWGGFSCLVNREHVFSPRSLLCTRTLKGVGFFFKVIVRDESCPFFYNSDILKFPFYWIKNHTRYHAWQRSLMSVEVLETSFPKMPTTCLLMLLWACPFMIF